MLVLYASQTGNAKEIATLFSEDLGTDVVKLGTAVVLHSMDDYLKANKDLEEVVKQPVVFVVSTTGTGDMPDNGRFFSSPPLHQIITYFFGLISTTR